MHAYPQAKSTGQLSIVTYIFNLGGCVIRIFTSIQEGAGIAMVRGFILGRPPCLCLSRSCPLPVSTCPGLQGQAPLIP
ncbi:MAG: hypothetical protein EOO38_26330, partial [Cytophagaceae bacterium]